MIKACIRITDLWVPAGVRGQFRTVFLARSPLYGSDADYFDLPLSYDSFTTGPSDWDMGSDEIYCPCGKTLDNWEGRIGEALRMIDDHCHRAGHPLPKRDD